MTNNYETMILSKVIDTENISALNKHNIREESFISRIERDVYVFIVEYADRNGSLPPSYATVVSEIPEFEYVPGVTDSFEFLSEKIRQRRAEYDFKRLVQDELPTLYEDVGKKDMTELTTVLTNKLEEIRIKTRTGVRIGIDVKADIDKYEAEYRRRQIGESHRVFPSFLTIINDATGGGYASGNIYTVYGKSGRGKSVITIYEATYAAMNGANVLVWSMEMGAYETVTRIYSFISAMVGIDTEEIQGVKYGAGFSSDQLRSGQLDSATEVEFFRMLKEIGKHVKGNITVRGVDDPDFTRRDLEQLKFDIEETQADIVVVDPFYYLDYEINTSKTAGGDAAATSQRLRRLAGETETVVFAITQADETDDMEDENEMRILEAPARKDVTKTKQLLQDAALLIGIDTDYKQKLGIVSLNKGRHGGEGDQAEIVYIPSKGIVQEVKFNPEMFGF